VYDYGARFYDAHLARFHTIDPWAEDYEYQSPYLYAHNNPVRFTDFLGLGADDKVDDDEKKKKEEEKKKKEEEEKKKKKEEEEKKKKKEEEANLVSLDKKGEKVLPERTKWYEYVWDVITARTYTDENGLTWSVNDDGVITGLAPRCGNAPAVGIGGNGLKGASSGLKLLFKEGISGNSIINIRSILLKNGFKQTLTRNKSGYLFVNRLGEEVRIMFRNGRWDIRVKNMFNNNLDKFGRVSEPRYTHEIFVRSK
jgi:hypothetical protein